jgi:hypothetical protein
MTCSSCGYMMGPFDKNCPRCQNLPRTAPPPPQTPLPEPPAAPAATEPVPTVSVSRSASPLSIAASVICGILCVIGILLIIIGGIEYSRRKDPIYNMNTILHAQAIGGNYIGPGETEADHQIAQIQSKGVEEQSIKIMASGGAFCLPMVLLATFSIRKRKH